MSGHRHDPAVNLNLRDHAPCNGLDLNTMFPEPPEITATRAGRPYTMRNANDPGYQAAVAHARTICHRCPVYYRCLHEALAMPAEMDYGIRAALTPTERARLRRDETEVWFTRIMARQEARGRIHA